MTGPACGNNPNHKLTDGDRQAVDSFRAYVTARGALRDRIARALAAYDLPYFDRRHQYEVADAVLAVLPAPIDRAAVLREAAETILASAQDRHDRSYSDNRVFELKGAHAAAAELRRMADECPECGTTGACTGGPCPLRRVADETAATETPECAAVIARVRAITERAANNVQRPAARLARRILAELPDQGACPPRCPCHQPAAGARQDGAQPS